jgi:hypothetical protein
VVLPALAVDFGCSNHVDVRSESVIFPDGVLGSGGPFLSIEAAGLVKKKEKKGKIMLPLNLIFLSTEAPCKKNKEKQVQACYLCFMADVSSSNLLRWMGIHLSAYQKQRRMGKKKDLW